MCRLEDWTLLLLGSIRYVGFITHCSLFEIFLIRIT